MSDTPAHVAVLGWGCSGGAGENSADIARALLEGGLPEQRVVFPGPLGDTQVLVRRAGVDADTLIARALDEALRDVDPALPRRPDTGLFVGSSSLNIGLLEQHIRDRGQVDAALPMGCDRMAQRISDYLGLTGPRYTVNTACSSSANALLHAGGALRRGVVKRALVVGLEIYNELSLRGFASLMLTSPHGLRSFDRDRDGLVLGEGVGALWLELADQDHKGFRVLGGATACDTDSPTTTSPEAIAHVIEAALDDAGCSVDDMRFIKAHGTGTPSNDEAEAHGIQAVFGAGLPPVTALKPVLGHTLGACGALELAALMQCLADGVLPANLGFANVDPALGLMPLTQARQVGSGKFLNNFFGFGGNNTSLVMELVV